MPRMRNIAILFGLAMVLVGCTEWECPSETWRPQDRARFCGPSNNP